MAGVIEKNKVLSSGKDNMLSFVQSGQGDIY